MSSPRVPPKTEPLASVPTVRTARTQLGPAHLTVQRLCSRRCLRAEMETTK